MIHQSECGRLECIPCESRAIEEEQARGIDYGVRGGWGGEHTRRLAAANCAILARRALLAGQQPDLSAARHWAYTETRRQLCGTFGDTFTAERAA